MRHFDVVSPTTLSAESYWSLRADFELEQALAKREGRLLERSGDDVETISAGGERRKRRVVRVELPDDAIPGMLSRWVKPTDLRSEVTYEWSDAHWDKRNAARVVVVFPHFGDCVKITYTQHVGAPLVPSDVVLAADAAVSVHTHCVIDVAQQPHVPGWVVSCIERVAEAQMRSSLERHPRELERLSRSAAPTARERTAAAGADGGPSPDELRVIELEARRAGDALRSLRPQRCFVECILCGWGRFVCGRVEALT